MHNSLNFEEFNITPTTIIEKIKLFFKKTKTRREILTKTDIIEISCTTYYKVLGNKKFFLDKGCCANVSLPDIKISLVDEQK